MTVFKAGDFAEQEWQPISSAQAASIANQKLQREAKVVYGTPFQANCSTGFHEIQSKYDTHRALLVCIEELPPKVCEHEPRGYSINVGGTHRDKYYRCEKCGVKLKAIWRVCDEQR